MGDSANFRYGTQSGGSGLEFVGAKKKSRFSQYVQQFDQPQQIAPVALPPRQQPSVQPVQQPVAYQQPFYSPQQQPAQPQQLLTSASQQAPLMYAEPAYMFEEPPQPEQVASSEQQVYTFDQEDNLGMEAPNMDELFNSEPAEQAVSYKKAPTSTIVRPKLDTKQRVSPLKAVFATIGVVLAFGVIGVSVWFISETRPAVSGSIKAAAGFPVYDMAASSLFKVDRSTVEINENSSLVYIVYQQNNNAKFIVSQQAIPEVIKDEAQFQQFLLETDRFASMDSNIGKAYFTRPANIGSDISIVVKTESTLMFIRGPGTTTEEDWSKLLAHLKK